MEVKLTEQLVLVFDKGFFGEARKSATKLGKRRRVFAHLHSPSVSVKAKAAARAVREARTLAIAKAAYNLTVIGKTTGQIVTARHAATALNALGFRTIRGGLWSAPTLTAVCSRASEIMNGKSAA